ncbi:MAG: GspH/FimT family pseudopilin [Xanthomonadales bacterium]|nr:GspH/FimT family pseudopilin [Xanthomonadales bacterium]
MHCHAKGFTLIEVMIVIAIMLILLAIATPSLGGLLRRSEVTTTHNALSTGFALARHHAVSHGAATTICPVAPDGGCRTDGVWDEGWWIFIDANGNARPDPAETLVHHENRIPARVRIRSGRGRPLATFRADGSAPGTNLSLRICSDSTLQSALILSNAGRARRAGAADLARLAGCD